MTGQHLLVDSSSIKMLGEGEWKTKKHGADYRRKWRKIHLWIAASTFELRAMEVTDNSIDATPVLLALLGQILSRSALPAPLAMALTTRRLSQSYRPARHQCYYPDRQERQSKLLAFRQC